MAVRPCCSVVQQSRGKPPSLLPRAQNGPPTLPYFNVTAGSIYVRAPGAKQVFLPNNSSTPGTRAGIFIPDMTLCTELFLRSRSVFTLSHKRIFPFFYTVGHRSRHHKPYDSGNQLLTHATEQRYDTAFFLRFLNSGAQRHVPPKN